MQERGELTRARILQAARSLFHLKGYTNTSMEEIVLGSGVAKGNLYYHFSNKEALGAAVVEILVSEWISSETDLSKEEDPIDTILRMFRETEKGLLKMNCKGGCLFGNLALEVSDLHDGLRQKVAQAFSIWLKRVEALLESGKARGIINPDLDSAATARFILSVFEGGILLSKVTKNVRAFKGCSESIRNYLEQHRAGSYQGKRADR